jgi:hypothetical protein
MANHEEEAMSLIRDQYEAGLLYRVSVELREWLSGNAYVLDPAWQCLDMNEHQPRVERMWRPFSDEQSGEEFHLLLHCIHPCDPAEAMPHPHLWPSIVQVLGGNCRVVVGRSSGIDTPEVILHASPSVRMESTCVYVMDHPNGWYVIIPENGPVYTIMLTEMPSDRSIPRVIEQARCTLPELDRERQLELLQKFRDLLDVRQSSGRTS